MSNLNPFLVTGATTTISGSNINNCSSSPNTNNSYNSALIGNTHVISTGNVVFSNSSSGGGGNCNNGVVSNRADYMVGGAHGNGILP